MDLETPLNSHVTFKMSSNSDAVNLPDTRKNRGYLRETNALQEDGTTSSLNESSNVSSVPFTQPQVSHSMSGSFGYGSTPQKKPPLAQQALTMSFHNSSHASVTQGADRIPLPPSAERFRELVSRGPQAVPISTKSPIACTPHQASTLSDLEAGVLDVMKRERKSFQTLHLARQFGLHRKKEINPTLYKLQSLGLIYKMHEHPPTWKVRQEVSSLTFKGLKPVEVSSSAPAQKRAFPTADEQGHEQLGAKKHFQPADTSPTPSGSGVGVLGLPSEERSRPALRVTQWHNLHLLLDQEKILQTFSPMSLIPPSTKIPLVLSTSTCKRIEWS
ncbi:unnamed protein product [Pocillopora meandrina]|uniref:Z-binding domain-containing protein n=1 Tax=Pocillopora meandrina TaxID=46732 RepID=A0AAU9Y5H9_9CNID|nr:unnamed protein product [Pocillopora meandrina]